MVDDEPFETDPDEILERQAAAKQALAAATRSASGFTRSSQARKTKRYANDDTRKAVRSGPSLKARAIQFLSRREHSRIELARKLAPHAETETELEHLLDFLEAEKWLSTERFARSLLNRRADKLGAQRIMQELRQHGITDEQALDLRAELDASEFERAQQVWEKKFNALPVDAKEHARQYRFMASRGFSGRVFQKILANAHADD